MNSVQRSQLLLLGALFALSALANNGRVVVHTISRRPRASTFTRMVSIIALDAARMATSLATSCKPRNLALRRPWHSWPQRQDWRFPKALQTRRYAFRSKPPRHAFFRMEALIQFSLSQQGCFSSSKALSEAGLLANAEMSVAYRDGCWRLSIGIPVESYLELEGRGYIENTIDSALTIPMEAVSRSDHLYCEIVTSLEPDPQLAATDTAMSRWRRGNQPGACAQRQNSDPRT
jgi:hypothetical protein